MTGDSGIWAPLTPLDVFALFVAIEDQVPWWIAGGYGIELFVGRTLREHGDIDVVLLRRDQHRIHDVLDGWDIHAAYPPGRLRAWPCGETLPEDVHDIWCRETPDARSPHRCSTSTREAGSTMRCGVPPLSTIGEPRYTARPMTSPRVELLPRG